MGEATRKTRKSNEESNDSQGTKLEGSIDPAALGLKCGLEIHQQLNTGKLFCRCPSTIIDEKKPDFTVTRYLRASAGETGEIDRAAQHEQAKKKRFTYYGYHEACCLVELDEEPPHPLNDAALEATLQFAKMVGSTILDEIHVMRKTVIDGSNTSGFQRTALVALGGKLLEEPVRIETICLEEDACKIIKRTPAEDIYNLSRLGIPLIEIATAPDITSPDQAGRVAAEIGMLLRSTGKCRRGLGTIRQDVNVSIKGGARVEIKGAQDLKLIPLLVENEARRQQGLLRVKDELTKRGFTSFLAPSPHDVSAIFAKNSRFIGKGIARGQSLVGIALPNFRNFLGRDLYPGFRLGTELAGYAKAFGFGGLIHSDEDPKKYAFTDTELTSLRKTIGVKKDDAFILILGDKERVEEFFAFSLIPRLEHLLHGVPEEVRRAKPDGTSTFLRPMPGAARMYPETDLRRVVVDASQVVAPKPLKEQEEVLVKTFRITQAHAKGLLREGWPFDEYVKEFGKLSPVFIATTLLDTPKELKKRYGKELNLVEHEDVLRAILAQADEAAVPEEAVIELLAQVADGKEPDFSKYAVAETSEVEKVVDEVIAAHPTLSVNALMGEAMLLLRGKASGKQVMALLRERREK